MSERLVWRIGTDTASHQAHDLQGKGAQKTGGRWNRKGTPMVYASESRALACLETVVHMAGGLPLNRYLVRIAIPEDIWAQRTPFVRARNVGWDAVPAGMVSMNWGTRWAGQQRTLLAEVPSVIVSEERNILLNPQHPDIGKLVARKIRLWTYDPRLG